MPENENYTFVADADSELVEALNGIENVLSDRTAQSWVFEIQRDGNGFARTIIATPLTPKFREQQPR